MTAEGLFRIANLVALAGWVLLLASLFVPRLRAVVWTTTGLVLPGVLALLYLLQIGAFGSTEGGFGSLAEIRTLFADDRALLAGWVHYLAFDMVVGTLIARDGLARGVPKLLLVVALPLTFVLGPVGFLLFLAARPFGRRKA